MLYLNEQIGTSFKDHPTRRLILLTFARWWDARQPFYPAQSLSKRMIEVWFATHRKKNGEPIAPVTRRNYASFIREFVRWGVGAHEFDVECIGFKAGKVSSRSVRPKIWLDEEFLTEVWENAHPYFRGLFSFTCMTLARGNEVIALKLKDLNSDLTRVNLVRTKIDDFDDKLPIVEDLQEELARYLEWYEQVSPRPLRQTDQLFPRYKHHFGKRDQVFPTEKRYGLWEPCKRLIVEHGLGTQFTLDEAVGIGGHTCRRSMARRLYHRLVELEYTNAMRIVQGMLGHTDIRITQAYIGSSDVREDRDRAMDQFTWKRKAETAAPVTDFELLTAAPWNEHEDLDAAA